MTDEVRNVIIIGSGPAGYTAAIYAARANLKPLLFQGMQPGGQLTITTDVENYHGYPDGVMGPELMEKMKAQCARFGTEFIYDEVVEADLSERPFVLKTQMGEQHQFDAVVIATRARAKYLGLENETRLSGYGVSACATCDGFFFQGVPLAVLGGGDSAMEEATFLTKFASKVYVIHRRDKLRASKIMQERAFKNDKVEFLYNHTVVDVLGEDKVTGVRLKHTLTGEESDLDVSGFFLAIGHIPNTRAFAGQLDLNPEGYIIVQPDSSLTSVPGVFAAGDVHDTVYKQAVTAAGSGCKAALDCERWLESVSEA